jgi:hypothetical protein
MEFQLLSSVETSKCIFLNEFLNKAPQSHIKRLNQVLKHPHIIEFEQVSRDVLNTMIRQELLNQLQQIIGYGGLIHSFKNIVNHHQ